MSTFGWEDQQVRVRTGKVQDLREQTCEEWEPSKLKGKRTGVMAQPRNCEDLRSIPHKRARCISAERNPSPGRRMDAESSLAS